MPYPQPLAKPEDYPSWPADWYYDARFSVDGTPRWVLSGGCPPGEQNTSLGYRKLHQHWMLMRKQAAKDVAEVIVACEHSGCTSPYDGAGCFNAELR